MTERRVVWVECPFHFAPERGVVVTCPVCGQYAGFAGDGTPGRIEVTLSPRDSALLTLGEAAAKWGAVTAISPERGECHQSYVAALAALRKIDE